MISSGYAPWYNEHEWYYVYKSLFQSDHCIEQQQCAITRITFWEQRCSNTPISISATKLLIQAIITDRTSSNGISLDQVQMLYGIAIVRFINSYVDAEQKKYYAESISNLACKLGIPSELVECRHRITHNADLPSLELLRYHAQLSLEYIVTTYWEPQAEVIRNHYTHSKPLTQFLLGLMAIYLDLERFTYSSFFFETKISLKHITEITSHSFSPLLVYRHFLNLTHLRSKRRQLKRLAVKLHTTEEELCDNQYVTEMFQSLRDWEGGFKNLLMFSRDFLCNVSYDETILSFLKDWVFIRRHPQEKNNLFVVLFVFWILNFVSVNLTYKLIDTLLKTLLVPVLSSYEINENVTNTLFLTMPLKKNSSQFSNQFNNEYYFAWERIFLKQGSSNTTQVNHHNSSKLESFLLMVCSTTGAYMAWLECFLLTPTNEQPFFLEWIAHTVCFRKSLRSVKRNHDVKNRIGKILVDCIYKTHQRVKSMCVSIFPYLFLNSLNGNILTPCQHAEQNQIIMLMKKISATLPEECLFQRLLRWFDPQSNASCSTYQLENDFKEFLTLVKSFSECSVPNHVILEKLNQLELDCRKKMKKGISVKKSQETLWTDPGTFLEKEPQNLSTCFIQCGLKYHSFLTPSLLYCLRQAKSFLLQTLNQKSNRDTVENQSLVQEHYAPGNLHAFKRKRS